METRRLALYPDVAVSPEIPHEFAHACCLIEPPRYCCRDISVVIFCIVLETHPHSLSSFLVTNLADVTALDSDPLPISEPLVDRVLVTLVDPASLLCFRDASRLNCPLRYGNDPGHDQVPLVGRMEMNPCVSDPCTPLPRRDNS